MTKQNSELVRLNVKLQKDEREAYHQLCKEMDTDASREIRAFIRQQLQAAGRYDPQRGVLGGL